jgi:hypothetical protein
VVEPLEHFIEYSGGGGGHAGGEGGGGHFSKDEVSEGGAAEQAGRGRGGSAEEEPGGAVAVAPAPAQARGQAPREHRAATGPAAPQPARASVARGGLPALAQRSSSSGEELRARTHTAHVWRRNPRVDGRLLSSRLASSLLGLVEVLAHSSSWSSVVLVRAYRRLSENCTNWTSEIDAAFKVVIIDN